MAHTVRSSERHGLDLTTPGEGPTRVREGLAECGGTEMAPMATQVRACPFLARVPLPLSFSEARILSQVLSPPVLISLLIVLSVTLGHPVTAVYTGSPSCTPP